MHVVMFLLCVLCSHPFAAPTPGTDDLYDLSDLYDLYDLYDLFQLHDVDLPFRAEIFVICMI